MIESLKHLDSKTLQYPSASTRYHTTNTTQLLFIHMYGLFDEVVQYLPYIARSSHNNICACALKYANSSLTCVLWRRTRRQTLFFARLLRWLLGATGLLLCRFSPQTLQPYLTFRYYDIKPPVLKRKWVGSYYKYILVCFSSFSTRIESRLLTLREKMRWWWLGN